MDEKRIQPPLQNNFIDDNEEPEEIDEDHEIHLIEDEFTASHLTQEEYEDSLVSAQSQRDA